LIWKNRIIKFAIFTFLLFPGFIQGKDKIFIDYPIGINERISSRFTKKPISGIVYRSFKIQNLQPKLVGRLYSSIKTGSWTGWWDNGKPKYHGEYFNGIKSGLWREWDYNGQLRFELYYIDGKVNQLKNCVIELCDSTITRKHVEIKFKN
tara:strand:- start:47 stop:496 length:450 start_codon:yes stop_codon:yes gene_type:complete